MTIEFGVARDEIMGFVEDMLLAGFASKYPQITAEKLFWDDGAPDNPVPAKPYISCRLLAPASQTKARDFRTFLTHERWEIRVTDSADGAYSIEIQGVPYSLVASGLGITALRDALLAELAADTESTSTAVGADTIEIVANVEGERLFVLTDPPASLVRTRTSTDAFERQHQVVECQLQVGCWGKLDNLDPQPFQTGRAIAEFVESLFNARQMTAAMRDRGHVPRRVSILDNTNVENQQAQSEAIVQVVLATDSRLDVQVASTTAVAVRNASPQITP